MTRIVIAAKRGQFYPVDACVFGEWAAHPSHLDEPTWCVTHVPTGRRAHSEVELDERTAMAIAEALSLEVPGGAVPAILPTDKNPEMPLDVVQRINATFYRVLKSYGVSSPGIDRSSDGDHVYPRGER